MSNTQHPRMKEYYDRYQRVEGARIAVIQDTKDLIQEMKSAGLTEAEILGVRIASRRAFMTQKKLDLQTSAEHIADQLAESGTAPLFAAGANVRASATQEAGNA